MAQAKMLLPKTNIVTLSPYQSTNITWPVSLKCCLGDEGVMRMVRHLEVVKLVPRGQGKSDHKGH